MENRQYFTEFVIIDGKNSSNRGANRVGNYIFEIEVDLVDVKIETLIDTAKSMIVLESKRKGFLVSKEQIHFRQFNRI